MPSSAFAKLACATFAAHVADQMMLAMLPLMLLAAGYGAGTISTVVAVHAAAWLLVSLPVGVLADTLPRRTIMLAGATTMLVGAAIGGSAVVSGYAPPTVLALAAFCIAAGVVMLVLAVFALLPRHIDRARLSTANATLEFGRAIICIAAPLIAAHLVARQSSALGFAAAFGGGLIALMASRLLPDEPVAAPSTMSMMMAIREGATFVIQEPLLRAIALCAIAWNSAFFALTAIFAVYASQELGMSIAAIGAAWSIYGTGLVLGSLAAPAMIARLPTGLMFVFGPLSCGLGIVAMVALAGPGSMNHIDLGFAQLELGPWSTLLGFFCLGFGPMTWLVLQTSARQIVTPGALLGRVGATISTTIYGVRPIGALAAAVTATVVWPERRDVVGGNAVCDFSNRHAAIAGDTVEGHAAGKF